MKKIRISIDGVIKDLYFKGIKEANRFVLNQFETVKELSRAKIKIQVIK